jgi:hypothetical protein
MGTTRTLGILFGSLVSWMRWAVLPRRGDRLTGVASVAGGIGRRGIAGVIGGSVPGILFRVMRRWTLFVDFSARFVVGFGTFNMGGALDIRQRSCTVVMSGVVPTLCSALGVTLCWSCVWYPLLGHPLRVFFWQDPCVAWAREESWPLGLCRRVG